jgi:zinc D-Ala-D-Ala carboxypeptidase
MDYRISEYFWHSEIGKSAYATRNKIPNTPPKTVVENATALAINVLDPVRRFLGSAVEPQSWYRSPKLNLHIGGSPNSQHMKGEAVDMEHHSVSNYRLAEIIHLKAISYDQLILEFYNPKDPRSGWVHVSCKKDLSKNRKQALIFDGKKYSPLVFKK